MDADVFLPDLVSLLDDLCQTARQAGKAVLEVYAGHFDVNRKGDNSPVTAADLAAERIILEDLHRLYPSILALSEESAEQHFSLEKGIKDRVFFLIDPLDGTKEFVARNGEFTVNIALIVDRKPIVGVVYAPALGRLYAGAVGLGASFYEDNTAIAHPIRARRPPPNGLTVVASRSHGAHELERNFLTNIETIETKKIGSSLKFCLLAEGMADVYPRFSPTMEWDTAAGHAVLSAAGGRVATTNDRELEYGKVNLLNPGFVAWGAYK